MSDADCTPGREPRSVAASYTFYSPSLWYGRRIAESNASSVRSPRLWTKKDEARLGLLLYVLFSALTLTLVWQEGHPIRQKIRATKKSKGRILI